MPELTPPDDLDDLPQRELEALARSQPTSGRGQAAKLGALRVLERRARSRAIMSDVPADLDLDQPCGTGRIWHPMAGTGWERLDAGTTIRTRLQWKHNIGADDEPIFQ